MFPMTCHSLVHFHVRGGNHNISSYVPIPGHRVAKAWQKPVHSSTIHKKEIAQALPDACSQEAEPSQISRGDRHTTWSQGRRRLKTQRNGTKIVCLVFGQEKKTTRRTQAETCNLSQFRRMCAPR